MTFINFIENTKENSKLAIPIILGQISHIITSMADTIMIGKIGSNYLAASSFANSIYIILFLFAIGFAMGLTPLVGIANGEKNIYKKSVHLKNGLLLNFIVNCIIILLNLIQIPFFKLMGQEETVVELSIPYYIILSLSLLPYTFFITFKQFFEGIESTKIAMYIALFGNLLNIILNYLFIYGIWIFPEWKLFGVGFATFIARTVMGFAFLLYFLRQEKYNKYIKNLKKIKYSLVELKILSKLGLPIALQILMEVTVFSVGAIMVGWSGAESLAAHQIVISLASLTFLAASGLASAGTIRLSNLLGANQKHKIKEVSNSIFIAVLIFMGVCGIIFYIFRHSLPTLFISEEKVILIASNLLIYAAIFQVFDGLQVTAFGVLRGIKDVKIPTTIAFIVYWVVGILVCYLLSSILNLGAQGIWIGYLTILFLISTSLIVRFFYKLKLI